MRVPGDLTFLYLLEDLNGRFKLAHIAQRAGELNESVSSAWAQNCCTRLSQLFIMPPILPWPRDLV